MSAVYQLLPMIFEDNNHIGITGSDVSDEFKYRMYLRSLVLALMMDEKSNFPPVLKALGIGY